MSFLQKSNALEMHSERPWNTRTRTVKKRARRVDRVGRSESVAQLVGVHGWIGRTEIEQGFVPLKVHGHASIVAIPSGDYFEFRENAHSVPGLYGFDVRGPSSFPSLRMHYWSSILNILRKTVGAEVTAILYGEVNSDGRVRNSHSNQIHQKLPFVVCCCVLESSRGSSVEWFPDKEMEISDDLSEGPRKRWRYSHPFLS